jgi:hypothetical protein
MGLPSEANALLGSTDQYRIERSLRFRGTASACLTRTPAVASNRRTWTWSAWVKRGSLGGTQTLISAGADFLFINSAGNVRFQATSLNRTTPVQVCLDPSAWYHFVLVVDTTLATALDRVILYINGLRVDGSSTITALNEEFLFNSVTAHEIGRYASGGTLPFDGYMAEVNFIDGQALTPSSFGQTDPVTGVWMPRRYTGTYGTNGFYLKFTDNSAATAAAIGRDFSGNGNNFTPTNISVTAGTTFDSMIDSPTNYGDGGNGRGNYAVWNPLSLQSSMSITDANLTSQNTGTVARTTMASIGVASGKWYWELTAFGVTVLYAGICSAQPAAGGYIGDAATGWAYANNGQKINAATFSAYGASWTTNDVIGVALDMDAGTITFYKNNVSQGQAFTGITGTVFPAMSPNGAAGNGFNANFGQRPFAYTPPAGFRALNTQNLPTPLIERGANHFDTVLYTGDGVNGRTITSSLRFTPGLAWGKSRSTVRAHAMVDSVRGNFLTLSSNATAAESAINSYAVSVANSLLTFNSNETNENGATFVTWLWNRGAVPGFDIVTYTGTGNTLDVPHNLGVVPRMIIVKARNNTVADNWGVYHGSLSILQNLYLNLTNAATSAAMWRSTPPTSTVFTVGINNDVNRSGINYVAYVWAEVPGFSRFGSYTGNGSTDGPFVWCGFRPRWVMFKRTDTTGDWVIFDTARAPANTTDLNLTPNAATVERTDGIGNSTAGFPIDILSNGFKQRSTGAARNASGGTYVFAAFAENPFKIARAR